MFRLAGNYSRSSELLSDSQIHGTASPYESVVTDHDLDALGKTDGQEVKRLHRCTEHCLQQWCIYAMQRCVLF